jgi:hypothetical protein
MGVSKANQRCQCGASVLDAQNRACYALTMQLATIGGHVRRRSKGATVYACGKCVRLILTKVGRDLRKALALTMQAQAVDLQRQKRGARAIQS